MGRQTKPLSGGGKDKFLRGLVEAVDGIAEGPRRALTQALTDSISEVRVRREAYDRVRNAPEPQDAPTVAPNTEAPPFDPFAFSVITVLTKRGKAGLHAELDKVGSIDHLRHIADAQHLALDPALSTLDDIRAAIVTGTERRIAERKAAAS